MSRNHGRLTRCFGCALLVSIALALPVFAVDEPGCTAIRKAQDGIETAVGIRQYESQTNMMGGTRAERLVRVLTKDSEYVRVGDRWVVDGRAEALRARRASTYGGYAQCKAGGKESVGGLATTRYDYLSGGLKSQMWVGGDGLPHRIVSERSLLTGGGTVIYRYEYGAFEPPS